MRYVLDAAASMGISATFWGILLQVGFGLYWNIGSLWNDRWANTDGVTKIEGSNHAPLIFDHSSIPIPPTLATKVEAATATGNQLRLIQ